MSEERDGWRECADPVELAAAVAAGVEVQRNWGYDWQPGTNNETAEQFAGCTKANCRYRVPASWSWSPEPPAPDDLVSRARRHAETHPESRELIEELLEELLEAVVRWACFAAPPPVPSWPDGVLRDAANRLRWIANSGYIEDPGIKRIIRSWADELDATPVPPWPGAVLSGLVDEDGVPTWLAQAGQVRGEQVRRRSDLVWVNNDQMVAFSDTVWVEVRDPRAVPEPETERVPWWEARTASAWLATRSWRSAPTMRGRGCGWSRVARSCTHPSTPMAPSRCCDRTATDDRPDPRPGDRRGRCRWAWGVGLVDRGRAGGGGAGGPGRGGDSDER
ncbi:MAG: hypothetical protein IPG97_13455 [Microthrixaceae bacterium]|nr:hypothetical protein [Microthrixaceae bacterium]